MSLSVLNNVGALHSQYNIDQTQNSLGASLQRLSSGLKINSGVDGPAAYVLNHAQSAQITGLNTAISNTANAVNFVQTASGALGEVGNLLNQIRGLAVDSANAGVNDSTALAANQAQITNALSTINHITGTTQFGGQNLFGGSSGQSQTSTTAGAANTTVGATNNQGNTFSFQIGPNANQTATINLGNLSTSTLGTDGNSSGSLAGIDVTKAGGASSAISVIDKAISQINNLTGQVGSFQSNVLQQSSNNLNASLQNTTSAYSTIDNTNFAAETANFTQQNVLLQSGAQVLKTSQGQSQLVLSLLQGL